MKSWGYDPIFLSVNQRSGLAVLEEMLEGQTTVVVGPSGVGKSSLINALRCNQNISEEDPIHQLVEQVTVISFRLHLNPCISSVLCNHRLNQYFHLITCVRTFCCALPQPYGLSHVRSGILMSHLVSHSLPSFIGPSHQLFVDSVGQLFCSWTFSLSVCIFGSEPILLTCL